MRKGGPHLRRIGRAPDALLEVGAREAINLLVSDARQVAVTLDGDMRTPCRLPVHCRFAAHRFECQQSANDAVEVGDFGRDSTGNCVLRLDRDACGGRAVDGVGPDDRIGREVVQLQYGAQA